MHRLKWLAGLIGVLGALSGCTLASSSDLTKHEPVITPAFIDKEHKVDYNNGFKLVAWTQGDGDTCDIDTSGMMGTGKAKASGNYDWIWVATQAEAPANDGDSCFIRLTDDNGRLTDVPMAQAVNLSAATDQKPSKTAPTKAFLFAAPAQWSSSPHAKVELFVYKTLVASWEAKGVDDAPLSTNPQSQQNLEVSKMPVQVGVETMYKGMPSGRIESSSRVVFTPKDTDDEPHRWVYVINSPEEAKGVYVGKGSVPVAAVLAKPVDVKRDIHIQGAAYAFERGVDLAEVPACSIKEKDGQFDFRSPFSMNFSMPLKGGHAHVPSCVVTGHPGSDPDDVLFDIPVQWSAKADEQLTPDTPMDSRYRAAFASSRGRIVDNVSGQSDHFTIAMTKKEAQDLVGGGFTWFVTFETRVLVGSSKIDAQLAVGESPIFTLSSALERSDNLVNSQ